MVEGLAEFPRTRLPDRFGKDEDAEIGGDRVEAARGHDLGAGLDGAGVMLIDGIAHEEDLAGEVAVVGAGLGAGGQERHPVFRIRADGCDDHSGRAGQIGDGISVRGIEDQNRPVGSSRTQVSTDLLELVAVAPGQGDACPRGRVVDQVLGGQLADEASGAEEDEIVVACGHGANLGQNFACACRARPVGLRS